MSKAKALCIFTTILGHSTVVNRLTEVLDSMPDLQASYLLIGSEDYAKYPAPTWIRATAPWHAEFIARKKATLALQGSFDILLVNAWELIVAFRHAVRRWPCAAVLDATPASMEVQLRKRRVDGWKRRLAYQVHHRTFASVAQQVDYFLPKGSDCANSLHADYGIPHERCFQTLVPQHLSSWRPSGDRISPSGRLLFVGNDFLRKGGDFLLRVYREHLAPTYTLTIASNDPVLVNRPLPAGVELVRGKTRDELLQVFQASDLFVFPSQQDFTPEVVAEALAVGLPCVVADIEGVRDLVIEGQTGYRMARSAPPEQWASIIRRVLADPVELARLSTNARRFAEEKFSFERFSSLMGDIVCRLRAGKINRCHGACIPPIS